MLARLVVHLTSNYSQLTQGLQVARSRVSSFVGGVRGAVAGLAALGATAGMIAGVTSQLKALDQVADLAQATGFGGAAINALGYAAEQNGGSVESLQKGLKKFSVNMGQAASGTGPALDAFRRLNLSFRELSGLSPDEQILTIAEAMRGLPDEAARNAVAMELFGKSGVELAQMLSLGKQGLQAFIDEAKSIGLGFDAAELARVQEANDAMNRLKRTLDGVFGALAVAIAPIFERAVSGASAFIQSLGGVMAIIDTMAAGWAWLQSMVTRYILIIATFWEFSFNHMSDIAELVLLSVVVGFLALVGTIEHFFGVQLPMVLVAAWDNFGNAAFTAFDYVTTILINFGQNVRNIMSAIWEYIASGGTAELALTWTPLTQGFVNTLKGLEDIPPRTIGPLEAEMQAQVDALGNRLQTGLTDIVKDRLATLDAMERNSPTAANGFSQTDQTKDQADGGTGKADQKAGALAKGSAEAFSAIFAAMRNSKEDKQAAMQQQQVAAGKRTAVATEKIAAAVSGAPRLTVVNSLG